MKLFLLACAILLLGFLGTPDVLAQTPAPPASDPTPLSSPPAPPTFTDQAGLQGDWFGQRVVRPGEDLWAIDALLGLPTAVRAQRLLGRGERLGWGVEGLAGFELIFPLVGVGVRAHTYPLCGKHDALVFAPGVDAFLVGNTLGGSGWFSGGPAVFGFFAADVDITWSHTFSRGVEGQLGCELGGGMSSAGRGVAIPVVSFLIGCRF